MNPLIYVAKDYLARGWNPIPVGADKIPPIKWQMYQKQRVTEQELETWFTQFPDAQLAVITGEISNLTVVDVEVEGDLNLVTDETYTVKTGGGGKHWYFKYDPDFRNKARVLPFTDIRSEGGYVLVPPSRSSKGLYTVLKDAETIQMSSSLKTRFLEHSRGQSGAPSSFISTPSPVDTQIELFYPGFGKGERNDQMTRYVGQVLARIHPSLWDSVGLSMVLQANQRNTPPLSDFEVRQTFQSISNRERTQNPLGRDFTPRVKQWGPAPDVGLAALTRMGVKPEAAPVGVPHVELAAEEDVLATDDKLIDETTGRAKILHFSEVAELQKIDTDNTFATNLGPVDEALCGGFCKGDVIVVAGHSGSGKTSIMQDWSVTLAMAGLPALWFSYEVLPKPMWKKFENMGATVDTPIFSPAVHENYTSLYIRDLILDGIKSKGIKVVAIDHLGFVAAPPGNYSNGAEAITQTVRFFKKLAVKYGLIILLPVHIHKTKNKNPELDDIQGSSGLAQESDAVFFINRQKDSSGGYTTDSRLILLKNRKTGHSVSIILRYNDNRYYHSVESSKKDKDLDTALKQAEADWDNMFD